MSTHRDPEPIAPAELLAGRPPGPAAGEHLDEIARRVAADGRVNVILDDDPTGVQSVHDVPVLSAWEEEDLVWVLEQPGHTAFILTNSRSLPEAPAAALAGEIVGRLVRASERTGRGFVLTSRSDSTLRGHFPAETDAMAAALGEPVDGVLLCPAFFGADRFTLDDVHWVLEGDLLVPAGLTEFARDRTFGYTALDLPGWAQERSGGRIAAADVASVSLEDVRAGRTAERLAGVEGGRPVVVNAVDDGDLEAFVLGLLDAEAAGKRFIYRVGPSFPRARGGITMPEPLTAERLFADRPGGGRGLVVVGSHVEMTSRQLEQALTLGDLETVELQVPALLEDAEGEIARVVAEAAAGLERADVVVATSRKLATAAGGQSDLDIGAVVAGAVVDVVRGLDLDGLSWLIAKGGITSSDVGTKALGVRRATVAGPLLAPGIVPVWILPGDSAVPGLPYVIFPGNVGGPGALRDAIEIMRGGGG